MTQMIKLIGKEHDLGGGMKVHRILPQREKRMVGPFCFLDHMGPFTAEPGQNTDVRPHPHIGLSTLTYLLEGRILHHDSLDCRSIIVPGEVNWMTAGRGISHSERTPVEDRERRRRLEGLQFWIALPDGQEEIAPSFAHYPREQIPRRDDGQAEWTVIAGSAWGMHSPVKTSSPMLFATVQANQRLEFALEQPGFELAVYVIKGRVNVGTESLSSHELLVFEDGVVPAVQIEAGSLIALIGGQVFTTPRYIWWNLVSSSKVRIEIAKQQWSRGEFPMVPGEAEFIPLPTV